MGTTRFVPTRLGEAIPENLRRYWSGGDLTLGGRWVRDIHVPRGMPQWAAVERLTLLPGVDHNTMFYSLHSSRFPALKEVRLVGTTAFEWWQYRLPSSVVWTLPRDAAEADWGLREVQRSIECGADLREGDYSIRDVVNIVDGIVVVHLRGIGWVPLHAYDVWVKEVMARAAPQLR